MTASKDSSLLIAGGGIAGCLLLSAVRHFFPLASVRLLEKSDRLGGEHTWCFHESDVPPGAWPWLRPLISKSWDGYQVQFPKFERYLKSAYHAIRSEDLDFRMRSGFSKNIFLNSEFSSSPLLTGEWTVDCRGWPRREESVPQGFQKFVGWDLELHEPHGLREPVLKDARVPQTDGYRFFYLLPWDEKRLLVEDTYYSNSPVLQTDQIEIEILNYIRQKGWRLARVLRREQGCLPLPYGEASRDAEPGLSLGARSGSFNPVTGYTVPRLLREIQSLMDSGHFNENSWRQILREQRSKAFRQNTYLRLLNTLMFEAALPAERYKILERFYGLPQDLISRFYSSELSRADQFRILLGKPPVPMRRAWPILLGHWSSSGRLAHGRYSAGT